MKPTHLEQYKHRWINKGDEFLEKQEEMERSSKETEEKGKVVERVEAEIREKIEIPKNRDYKDVWARKGEILQ